MSFETIDWEAEARRVARAFGIDSECAFLDSEQWKQQSSGTVKNGPPRYGGRLLCGSNGDDWFGLPSLQAVNFSCEYQSRSGRSFSINSNYVDVEAHGENFIGHVNIGWHGDILVWARPHQCAVIFTKGLFYLGLLTPEIEAALNVSVSAHEKLEWLKEFEARYGL